MAEPIIYKFGEKDLDLDHYIYNLSTNVQDYLEHTNWNDALKEEFINSYNKYIQGLKDQLSQNSSRFSTDSFGTIIDTEGEFSDEDTVTDYYDSSGNKITAEDYNNLKDKKKKKYSQFNANKKVAQYFNLVGKKLSEYKKEEAEKFDLAKHGFINTWGYSVDPTGNPDLQIYLNKDILDEKTGKRGRTERAKYLAELLQKYKNNLKDYDFTDSTVGNREDYIKKLDAAITELNNDTFDNNDAEALLAIGIDRDFRNNFFSEFDTVNLTEADWKTEKEAERKQQEIKAAEEEATALNDDWETYYIDRYNKFNKRRHGRSILQRLPKPLSDAAWNKVIEDGDLNQLDLDDLYKQLYKAERVTGGDGAILKVLSAAIQGESMTKITEGVHKGKFYLSPPDGLEGFETTNYASMVYDPTTNTILAVFSGEIPKYTRLMLENFLKSKGKIPNRNFSVPPLLSYNKEGGIIEKFLQGNSLNSFVRNEYETKSKERAEKAGKTVELYKEGLRKLSQDFDADDIAELSAIGLDIASIVSSFIPGAGTAVSLGTGLASTAASTYANWDNQGFWDNMGDLTANVGLDLVGLIPGIGAAAKIRKIVKPLAKWGPRVLGLAAAGSLALDNNAAQAWGKVKDLKFSDLTADDLKAIGETLSIIAGGTSYYRANKNANAAREYIKKYQVNNPEKFSIKTKEGIDVEVDKDTYEAILNAPDLEKANELLNVYKKNKSGNEAEEVVNILTTTKGRKRKKVVSKEAFQHTPAVYLERPELKKLTWNPKTWGDNNLNNHILRWNTYGMPARDPKENRAVKNLFESHKQGGRLSFSKVRKFRDGGINDVNVDTGKYDWHDIMVNKRFYDYLDQQMESFRTKEDFVKWFNTNLDSWYDNLKSTEYTRGGQAKLGINDNVRNRQEWFRTTGLNANIEDAVAAGIIKRRGGTTDNLEGNYVDNYFGSLEYLRHFGTAEALNNELLKLTALKNWFALKGFTYDSVNNGMMHVGIIDPDTSEIEEGGKPAADVNGGGKKPGKTNPEEETDPPADNRQVFRDRLNKIFGNTFLTHDIPRAFIADKFNRKMTDLYKQNPILQNPFEFHRYVKSNLPAEMAGQYLAGQYRNFGNKATTSDGNLYTALQLGAETKAKEAILQGLMQSDLSLQTSSEAAWAQEKENAKSRYTTAQNNKVVLNLTAENNDKIKASLLNLKGEIIKNLIAKHQYDIETEKAKKDGIREQFALLEIENYTKTKILEGNTLSQAEKDAFAKVESGTRPSDLKPGELTAYNSAYKKLSKFKWEELKKYYEIGNTPWYLLPTSKFKFKESKKPKKEKHKKGGTLKARTADAERFQKLIIETMKKNERMLDRVSKSMFKFTKDWIVK